MSMMIDSGHYIPAGDDEQKCRYCGIMRRYCDELPCTTDDLLPPWWALLRTRLVARRLGRRFYEAQEELAGLRGEIRRHVREREDLRVKLVQAHFQVRMLGGQVDS